MWDASTRTVRCLACASVVDGSVRVGADPRPAGVTVANLVVPAVVPNSTPSPVPVAGGSAQREFQRRSQRREAGIRSRRPRLGGLILALTEDPVSTRVWAQGAQGERAVAAKLDELAGQHLVALHDRRMLRPDGRPSRANIDHLAVCASGVWVVDAKTHKGELQVCRSGGLFGPRVEKLFIAGRDKTSLLDGLAWQVEVVRGVLLGVGADVPVRGALCFVGTELPWFGASIGGVPLVGRRGLAKLLKAAGDFDVADRAALAEYLDRRFVPA
ncbi:MAG: hypothetical protein JWM93_3718 [Frankiales bacterium]|nr:hypothetical protein [Frankiales bacterium]